LCGCDAQHKNTDSRSTEVKAIGPLRFEPAELKLGKISDGSKVAQEVLLINTTGDTVNITKIVTDCGCTVANVPTKTIPPGEKISVEIDFRAPITLKRSVFQKNVAVQTSAGIATLPITGEVRPRIEADLTDLSLGSFEKRPPPQTVTFTNQTGEPLEPDLISAPEGLRVLFSPENGGKFKAEFAFADTAMLAGDWVEEKVVIGFANPFISKAVITISGSRHREIQIEPPIVNFGFVDEKTKPVVVKALSTDKTPLPIQLLSVLSTPKAFRVEILPSGARISPLPSLTKAGTTVREEILFRTDCKTQPLASVHAIFAAPQVETSCCGKTKNNKPR
jgi:hypothetical protein